MRARYITICYDTNFFWLMIKIMLRMIKMVRAKVAGYLVIMILPVIFSL